MQEDAASSLDLSATITTLVPLGALLGVCTLYYVSQLVPTTVYRPISYTLSPFSQSVNAVGMDFTLPLKIIFTSFP